MPDRVPAPLPEPLSDPLSDRLSDRLPETGATAAECRPALRRYAGQITRPDRWACYSPRAGDVVVCTPAKSGTTWTQSILAMLLAGRTELEKPVPVISPWVDADLGISEAQVTQDLAVQTGRRVIKTHTPLDGFPDWAEIAVVTVYRHPLDVFFSLLKHYQNMTIALPDDPILAPLPEALAAYLHDPVRMESYSSKTLAAVALHYRQTLETDRSPAPARLHYADMQADPRAAVCRLAQIAQVDAPPALIDAIVAATSFAAMKTNAAAFTPGAGTGLFHSDAGFFDEGRAARWQGAVPPETLALFEARLAEELPDPAARAWLCGGDQALRDTRLT